VWQIVAEGACPQPPVAYPQPIFPSEGPVAVPVPQWLHHLDCTAALLESQDLYGRADELRALAQRLREDARQGRQDQVRDSMTTYAPAPPPGVGPWVAPPSEADQLRWELDNLRDELRRVREAEGIAVPPQPRR
jgi:hypothetical protein